MEIKNPISLSELAKELKINKSKLSFYVNLGLLKPIMVTGKMMIFDRKAAVIQYSFIQKYKKNGFTLTDIKKICDAKFRTK